jgi:peptide/nickel transport system permease protein
VADTQTPTLAETHSPPGWLRLLWADKYATVAAVFLLFVVAMAIFGPSLFADLSSKVNFRGRNLAPFQFEHGWLMILGADSLGRPILARILVAAQNTMTNSSPT